MSNTDPTPEERQRIVNDIVGKAFPQKAAPETEDQRIMGRAMLATRTIRDRFMPVIAAHGFPDKKLHGLMIGRAFLEEFNSWPKEDLVYLACVIHTDALLEKLR